MGIFALDIDVVRPRELSAERLARWAELQAADPALGSPFLSPNWARAVEAAQGDSRGVRVAVLREDGRDVGFLPFRLSGATARPAGAPMCDYQGLIAEPGLTVDARRLVQGLGAQRFDFSHMLAEQAAFAPYMRGRTYSHIVDVAGGYGAYEAERRAAGTGVLRDCEKKRRKAGREIGEPVFTAFSRSDAAFDQLIALKRQQMRSTGQTDIFESPWTLDLLRELFASRDPDFGAVLFTLHFGDRLAAVHLHLRGQQTIHGWIIAHDPAFERYSPGLVLFQDILRWMEPTPYVRLDLGPGDYRFKRELANTGQWVAEGFVGTLSPAALVRTAAYGVVRAAEALPLGPVSELPGKAMRRIDRWRALR